jgi:hypothetical protein
MYTHSWVTTVEQLNIQQPLLSTGGSNKYERNSSTEKAEYSNNGSANRCEFNNVTVTENVFSMWSVLRYFKQVESCCIPVWRWSRIPPP